MPHIAHSNFDVILLMSFIVKCASQSAISSASSSSRAEAQADSVSIGISAPGYIVTYAVAGAIFMGHIGFLVHRSVFSNGLVGAKASVSSDRQIQSGYQRSLAGSILKISVLLFAVWLQIAMILATIGHYAEIWIFDLSIPKTAVDWDSYTRVFLMAWSTSILMAITAKVLSDRLRTFYMLPAPLAEASHVQMTQVMVDGSDPRGEMSVTHSELIQLQTKGSRHFDFLLRRYTWSDSEKLFKSGQVFARSGPTGSEVDAIRRVGGLSGATVEARVQGFGRNEIVLYIPSLFKMTVDELTSFFYIYQISACWLPFYWDYVTVGFLTLLLVLSSAMIKIRMEHKQKSMLKHMATLHGSVSCKRNNEWVKVTSEELVVGDLICLSGAGDILADCLIVSGHAIVDEAALTGETMPIQKFSCPVTQQHRRSNEAEHKKYFLFAGTGLVQSGGAQDTSLSSGLDAGATLAVVTATGSGTVRGELMRELIFGSSLKSSLFIELRYSLGILVLLAIIDFLSLNARFEMSLTSMLTAMYSIVGLINPLMAVSLVAGELRSANRLKANKQFKIYTRDLHRLTIAGKVDLVLLDKTGTITKSGLDFYGVIPSKTLHLTDCSSQNSDITPELSATLALAHTVSRCQGRLIGHQVELRMVETAQQLGWKFDEEMRSAKCVSGSTWTMEKLFPFSHETMTMSAIVSTNGQRKVICKGSFEALKGRCLGVSKDVSDKADTYAKDGCYVIAVGMKDIHPTHPIEELRREDVESDLICEGLLLFRNEVKPDSRQAIGELEAAGISVAMMTGDSVLTGAAVARTVGIIPPASRICIGSVNPKTQQVEWKLIDSGIIVSDDALAVDSNVSLCISGEAFAILRVQGRLNLEATKVYGRVSPNQKAEIVKLYTNVGKVVAMCGDGANDSSGLRAAHAGLALSGRTEASISAPFSTDSESLCTLTLLIREARAALCTSLASYQCLVVIGILYCISKSILLFQAAAYQAGLSYLYLDLFTTPLMLYGLVHSLPAKKLAERPPEGSLLGGQLVLSAIWSVFIFIAFLSLADAIMVNQDWFVPFVADPSVGLEEWQKRGNTFESALIFIWSAWVYIDVPLTYSTGGIHRAPIYTNWRVLLIACSLLAVVLSVMFVNASQFGCYFKVACSASESAAASGAFINNFLFPYEKVGGKWYNSQIDSTVYPIGFKLLLFFLFSVMCILHHVGHYFIASKLSKFVSETLGWDGKCVRRKAPAKTIAGVDKHPAKNDNKALERAPTAEYVIG